MPKFSLRWLLVGAVLIVFVGIVVLFVRDAQTPATPVALPLTHSFDQSPTGFKLKYPDDWNYAIPSVGIFIVAPVQTLAGTETGPTLTVQRAEPLEILGTIDKALNNYLQNGPLHTAGRWQVTDTVHPIQFNGRDARMVELEGAETAGTTPLHTQIIAMSANDTFVYFVTTTVPISKREEFDPTLEAMLKTVQILE